MDVDNLLATLLSLGFDYDECQYAITQGFTDVERAVKCLLNGKSKPTENKDSSFTEESNLNSNDPVVSRYKCDDSHKKSLDQFEQKKRENIKHESKKRRLLDKQARKAVLQQIKDDKEQRKIVMGQQKKSNDNLLSHSKSPSDNLNNVCRIKIRLSNGKNIIETCQCSELLISVVSKVKEIYHEEDDVHIIQPFPHRKFTEEDLQQSLMQLNLFPDGCITLKKVTGSVDNHEVHQSRSLEVNAQSHTPGGDEIYMQGEQDADDDEQEVENVRDDIRWRGNVGGSGMILGRHPHNPHAIDPVIHAESAAEAAEARAKIENIHPVIEEEGGKVLSISGDVESLVDMCLNDIARRLPGHQYPVTTLSPLSHRLCSRLLKCLMKRKTLTSKTLKYFLPCKLQRLLLDHYLYVSNELFYTMRLFQSLTHLSVQSCTVFTDKALEYISGLKKIIYLDLSNCTQLTNKCLIHLKMENLEVLKLDNTKVTDEGLCELFRNTQWSRLSMLSLCQTIVSSMDYLQAQNLKELRLAQTKVSDLKGLSSLTCLRDLNVSGSRIKDDNLSSLEKLKSLRKLNLRQTEISDNGLFYLRDLPLVELYLPERLKITDSGVNYLQDIPLISLDLTDYINITDKALSAIGRITTLKRLSLSKTKISDKDILLLKGLVGLKELDFTLTAFGDGGFDVFSYLTQLEQLSLSGTRITDDGLSSGKLNSLTLLWKLNLSRTTISDKGIKHLKLPELSSINLDSTMISEKCWDLLIDCPKLQFIRRENF